MAKKIKKSSLMKFLPILLAVIGLLLLLLLPAVLYESNDTTTVYNGIKTIFGYSDEVNSVLGTTKVTRFESSTILIIALVLSLACGALPLLGNKLLNLVAGTAGTVATTLIASTFRLMNCSLSSLLGTTTLGIGVILGAIFIGLSALVSLYASYAK